jgi:hypothetical protein
VSCAENFFYYWLARLLQRLGIVVLFMVLNQQIFNNPLQNKGAGVLKNCVGLWMLIDFSLGKGRVVTNFSMLNWLTGSLCLDCQLIGKREALDVWFRMIKMYELSMINFSALFPTTRRNCSLCLGLCSEKIHFTNHHNLLYKLLDLRALPRINCTTS